MFQKISSLQLELVWYFLMLLQDIFGQSTKSTIPLPSYPRNQSKRRLLITHLSQVLQKVVTHQNKILQPRKKKPPLHPQVRTLEIKTSRSLHAQTGLNKKSSAIVCQLAWYCSRCCWSCNFHFLKNVLNLPCSQVAVHTMSKQILINQYWCPWVQIN